MPPGLVRPWPLPASFEPIYTDAVFSVANCSTFVGFWGLAPSATNLPLIRGVDFCSTFSGLLQIVVANCSKCSRSCFLASKLIGTAPLSLVDWPYFFVDFSDQIFLNQL